MGKYPDVVVIGGGIVGANTAYLLSSNGLDVVLMDGDGIGSGSSGHGHGVIDLIGSNFVSETHWEFGHRASMMYPSYVEQLLADSGVDPLYHELPGLSLALDDEEERIFRGQYARHSHHLDLEWIDGDACRTIEPRISMEAIGGVTYNFGQVDGYLMAVAAGSALERSGGRVLNANATGLLREGGRVTGVEYAGGVVPCKAAIIANGAWAWHAADWLDFEVPVRPLHGEVLNVRLPGEPVRAFILTAKHGPIIPRRDGVLLVGATGGVTMTGGSVNALHRFDANDQTPPEFDLDASEADRDLIISRALQIMPSLEQGEIIAHLAGVRPLSADGMPLIGPVPGLDGAILATGHGTKGIHLGPITAQLAADYVLGDGSMPGIDAAAFRPERFLS